MKRLWVVTASARDTVIRYAETREEAEDAASFSSADWEIDSCCEADAKDVENYGGAMVWDGKKWVDASVLFARCTPEALAEAERMEREKAEFAAHPKLLEV